MALALAMAAQAQDEVPFITTPDAVTLAMLQLAGVTAQDHVIDLGSGDGRIVITAARRFGARGVGVELVPALVEQSRASARQAGVAARTEFRQQDLFDTPLAGYSVITMYLLPEVNLQLRPRLLRLEPGTRIVSHDWDLGAWLPDQTLTLDVPDKTIGRDKQSRLHLWVVPADVHGSWCAAGLQLQLTQRFQAFSAALHRSAAPGPGAQPAPLAVFDGRIDGRRLNAVDSVGSLRATLQLDGSTLRLLAAAGPLRLQEGTGFRRAAVDGCPR